MVTNFISLISLSTEGNQRLSVVELKILKYYIYKQATLSCYVRKRKILEINKTKKMQGHNQLGKNDTQ